MKKVLFLSLSGIGNYLMQAPAIAAHKKAFPDWHITVWVAPRGTKALADADFHVDEVIEMPIKASVAQHIKQILLLRKMNFDRAVVLSPGQLIKSAAYTYFAGIPERVGNTYPFGKNSASTFLLTKAIPEREHTHDVTQNFLLLEPFGIHEESTSYSFPIPASALRTGKSFLQGLHIPEGVPVIGFHAGSAKNFAFKRWPLDRFADVAATLIQQQHVHVLLLGGRDENEQKQFLAALIEEKTEQPESIHIISTDLLTTAAVMQACTLVIANDSGLMHLASAVGTPTIGLFGPTDESLTGPAGSNAVVLRAPNTKPVYNTETVPNLGDTPHETMLEITPEMVLNEAKKHL